MNFPDITTRNQYIEEVFKSLHYSYLYYVLQQGSDTDVVVISDPDYDELTRRIRNYEIRNPLHALRFSPTFRTGFPYPCDLEPDELAYLEELSDV